jgi:hypothetical protein
MLVNYDGQNSIDCESKTEYSDGRTKEGDEIYNKAIKYSSLNDLPPKYMPMIS